jgi:hypothetical protein
MSVRGGGSLTPANLIEIARRSAAAPPILPPHPKELDGGWLPFDR